VPWRHNGQTLSFARRYDTLVYWIRGTQDPTTGADGYVMAPRSERLILARPTGTDDPGDRVDLLSKAAANLASMFASMPQSPEFLTAGTVHWHVEGRVGSRVLTYSTTPDGPALLVRSLDSTDQGGTLPSRPGPDHEPPKVRSRAVKAPRPETPQAQQGLSSAVEALLGKASTRYFPHGDVDHYLFVPREGSAQINSKGEAALLRPGVTLRLPKRLSGKTVFFARRYDTLVYWVPKPLDPVTRALSFHVAPQSERLILAEWSGDGVPGAPFELLARQRERSSSMTFSMPQITGTPPGGTAYWRVQGRVGDRVVVYSTTPGGPPVEVRGLDTVPRDETPLSGPPVTAGGLDSIQSRETPPIMFDPLDQFMAMDVDVKDQPLEHSTVPGAPALVAVPRDGWCLLSAVVVSMPPATAAAVRASLGSRGLLLPTDADPTDPNLPPSLTVPALTALVTRFLQSNRPGTLPPEIAYAYRGQTQLQRLQNHHLLNHAQLLAALGTRGLTHVPAAQYLPVQQLAALYVGYLQHANGWDQTTAIQRSALRWRLADTQTENLARQALINLGQTPVTGAATYTLAPQREHIVLAEPHGQGASGNYVEFLDKTAKIRASMKILIPDEPQFRQAGTAHWQVRGEIGERELTFSTTPGGPPLLRRNFDGTGQSGVRTVKSTKSAQLELSFTSAPAPAAVTALLDQAPGQSFPDGDVHHYLLLPSHGTARTDHTGTATLSRNGITLQLGQAFGDQEVHFARRYDTLVYWIPDTPGPATGADGYILAPRSERVLAGPPQQAAPDEKVELLLRGPGSKASMIARMPNDFEFVVTGGVHLRVQGKMGNRSLIYSTTLDGVPAQVLRLDKAGGLLGTRRTKPTRATLARLALYTDVPTPLPAAVTALLDQATGEHFPQGDVERYLFLPRQGSTHISVRGVAALPHSGITLQFDASWHGREVHFARRYDTLVYWIPDTPDPVTGADRYTLAPRSERIVLAQPSGRVEIGEARELLSPQQGGIASMVVTVPRVILRAGVITVYWRVRGRIGDRSLEFFITPDGPAVQIRDLDRYGTTTTTRPVRTALPASGPTPANQAPALNQPAIALVPLPVPDPTPADEPGATTLPAPEHARTQDLRLEVATEFGTLVGTVFTTGDAVVYQGTVTYLKLGLTRVDGPVGAFQIYRADNTVQEQSFPVSSHGVPGARLHLTHALEAPLTRRQAKNPRPASAARGTAVLSIPGYPAQLFDWSPAAAGGLQLRRNVPGTNPASLTLDYDAHGRLTHEGIDVDAFDIALWTIHVDHTGPVPKVRLTTAWRTGTRDATFDVVRDGNSWRITTHGGVFDTQAVQVDLFGRPRPTGTAIDQAATARPHQRQPLSALRQYQPGGVQQVDQDDQDLLELLFPQDEAGNPLAHPPLDAQDEGFLLWFNLINKTEIDAGTGLNADPFRANNCLDTCLALHETLLGRPTMAAGAYPTYERGRPVLVGESGDKVERYAGKYFDYEGPDLSALARLEEKLIALGHNSTAIISFDWTETVDFSHVMNVANRNGTIIYLDAQVEYSSARPDNIRELFSIVFDAAGNPVHYLPEIDPDPGRDRPSQDD
jgi:hypothetical protein